MSEGQTYGREARIQSEGESPVTGMSQRNITFAGAYYKAMNDKDSAAVARRLHGDVQFVGPMANLVGKDAVVEAATGFMALIKGIRIRAQFGFEDEVMLAYDADFGEPIGICRTAVLMTFKDNLIKRIELFYDAAPFEKNLKKGAIFSSR